MQHQTTIVDVAARERHALAAQEILDRALPVGFDGTAILARHLQGSILTKDVGQREDRRQQQNRGDQDVLPAGKLEHVSALQSALGHQ